VYEGVEGKGQGRAGGDHLAIEGAKGGTKGSGGMEGGWKGAGLRPIISSSAN
jgi:hypothetical protein